MIYLTNLILVVMRRLLMKESISTLIIKASTNDKISTLRLLKYFNQQIESYSYKINGEDTKQDLRLFLLKFIHRYWERLYRKSDKEILSYISKSLKRYSFKLYNHNNDYNNELIESAITYEPDYALKIEIQEAMKTLSKKQSDIINKLYFLDIPVKDVANKYKVSVQSVYKIRNIALEKLRLHLN